MQVNIFDNIICTRCVQGFVAGIEIFPHLILAEQLGKLSAYKVLCKLVRLGTEYHKFTLLTHNQNLSLKPFTKGWTRNFR